MPTATVADEVGTPTSASGFTPDEIAQSQAVLPGTELRLADPTPAEPPKAAAPSKPLEQPPDLRKTVFRGYERRSTDELVAKLAWSSHVLTAERDGLRTRIEELERELEGERARSHAVADALVTAQALAAEVRAAAEREVAESLRVATAAKEDALREAEEILRAARSKADAFVAEMEQDVRDRQHEAEHVLDNTKDRLAALVRDLLERVPARPELSSSVPPEPPASDG